MKLSGIAQWLNSPPADATFLTLPDGSCHNYGEIRDAVARTAAWLLTRGVEPGDRVVIFTKNSAEIPILVFATASIGAIFVVLNDQLKTRGLEKILTQAEAKLIIADESIASALPDVPHTIIDADWREQVAATKPLTNPPEIDVESPVCLVFTSGSTGSPRGVTLTHANILFVVDAIQRRLSYRETDTIGCFLPLSFDYGLYQIFLAAISGATLFIGNPGLVGPRLPKYLRDAEVTVLPGVPTVYSALISLHRRRPFELPALRAITNTGERLPLAYIEELERMFPGLDTYVMYGLTECKRVSVMLPEEFRRKPDAVGRPLDGTEAYAVDASGRRLPSGEVGELVVTGPHVANLGYWRAPEETAKRYRGLELFTGDTGSVDDEGFLYFEARADDLLKHRGNRISPIEIEIEACALPGLVEGCVLQRKRDDTLHLFVTRSDETFGEKAILEQLRAVLEPAKVPDQVHTLTTMPKSMNGKIDRKSLLESLE